MDINMYLQLLAKEMKEKGASQDDVSQACQYANNLMHSGLPVIFNMEHFVELVGFDKRELLLMLTGVEYYYRLVSIPKKNGGNRELAIPSMRLRYIQRWILDNILSKIKVSEWATGFYVGRSILSNAGRHVGKECVLNLDVKDFFPSISYLQIYNVFYYYGYTSEVSYMLAHLCTYNGCLPQGAPTSPYLSNIVCLKLDKRLFKLAKTFEADYSRYADDITFSGTRGIPDIIDPVKRIVEEEGFCLNEEKTRWAFKNQRQEVTGLVVNDGKVSVKKAYVKKISQEIYYCKKYGVDDHLKHIGCDKRYFKDYIYGKVCFVNMIDKEKGNKLFHELSLVDWEK